MANRVNALSAGLGSVSAIISFYCQPLANDEVLHSETRRRLLDLANTLADENAGNMFRAVICAVLNEPIASTGYLHSVDKDGSIRRRYWSTGEERDTIIALIAD